METNERTMMIMTGSRATISADGDEMRCETRDEREVVHFYFLPALICVTLSTSCMLHSLPLCVCLVCLSVAVVPSHASSSLVLVYLPVNPVLGPDLRTLFFRLFPTSLSSLPTPHPSDGLQMLLLLLEYVV